MLFIYIYKNKGENPRSAPRKNFYTHPFALDIFRGGKKGKSFFFLPRPVRCPGHIFRGWSWGKGAPSAPHPGFALVFINWGGAWGKAGTFSTLYIITFNNLKI